MVINEHVFISNLSKNKNTNDTQTLPPYFNQSVEDRDIYLLYEQLQQRFKKHIYRKTIHVSFSSQSNRITPTVVFINLIDHKLLNIISYCCFILYLLYDFMVYHDKQTNNTKCFLVNAYGGLINTYTP